MVSLLHLISLSLSNMIIMMMIRIMMTIIMMIMIIVITTTPTTAAAAIDFVIIATMTRTSYTVQRPLKINPHISQLFTVFETFNDLPFFLRKGERYV